jgi:small conductance mechanosensitive channel
VIGATPARALTCDPNNIFASLCNAIQPRDPSGVVGPVLEHLLSALLVFLIIIVVGRMLRRIFDRTPAIRRNAQVRALIHNVTTAVTYILAILAGLVGAGLDISVLLTFGGLTSLGVGLAFQDVLRNLLAGIFLLLDQPFKVGDWITVEPNSGQVMAIQIRTTTLRSANGTLAVIPNLTCFTTPVIISTALDQRRFEVAVRVPRTADLPGLMRRARQELTVTRGLLRTPAPDVMPDVSIEEVVLHCRYWLDYKHQDADAIAADLAGRLGALAVPAPS